MVRFVRFSYYKTANRTALCDVVRCGAVILFCEQFWCGFYDLCGLCGLVNTPNYSLFISFLFQKICQPSFSTLSVLVVSCLLLLSPFNSGMFFIIISQIFIFLCMLEAWPCLHWVNLFLTSHCSSILL